MTSPAVGTLVRMLRLDQQRMAPPPEKGDNTGGDGLTTSVGAAACEGANDNLIHGSVDD